MAEYIDRKKVCKALRKEENDWSDSFAKSALQKAILKVLNIQSADVAPVVHGMWLNFINHYHKRHTGWQCSVCGFITYDLSNGETDYCPKCGAKMDLEE